jgi:quercetin 2,3-dioxygenase
MSLAVHSGTSRFTTREPGVLTRHSFSFGAHYDPGNVGLGPLVCHDDHLLSPGQGFAPHPHRDLEIVTWVVSGVLVHDGGATLRPGQVAVQSAGAGITHSEMAGDDGCRFVQAWLRPDSPGGTPVRDVAEVAVRPGRLTGLVGPAAPLPVGVAGASLAVVRLDAGGDVVAPAAPLRHLFVVTGAVVAAGDRLGEGDALRLTGEPSLTVTADGPAEVLLWSFDASDSSRGNE